MSTTTVFMLSMTLAVPEDRAEEMLRLALNQMPSSPASLIFPDYDGDETTLIVAGLSFEEAIPDLAEGLYLCKDGKLILCADILNVDAVADDNNIGPTRLDILFDALAQIGTAPDGTILGGWGSEYHDRLHPIIQFDGRPRQAYGKGTPSAAATSIGTHIPLAALALDNAGKLKIDEGILRSTLGGA